MNAIEQLRFEKRKAEDEIKNMRLLMMKDKIIDLLEFFIAGLLLYSLCNYIFQAIFGV